MYYFHFINKSINNKIFTMQHPEVKVINFIGSKPPMQDSKDTWKEIKEYKQGQGS